MRGGLKRVRGGTQAGEGGWRLKRVRGGTQTGEGEDSNG